MGAEPTIYCLEQLTDYDQFERFCSDLMLLEGYTEIEPLGGHKDKGRDALHAAKNNGKNTIFAFSVREDWLKKLNEDAKKIKKYGHPCDELVFLCTAKYTATERDNAVKKISAAYGFTLKIYGLERIRMLLNKHTNLIAQHPQIFIPAFFPDHTLAGKSQKATKRLRRSKSDLLIDLAPPTAEHQKPAFWEFGDKSFQEFCRDILAEDQAVRTCDQYGVPGKTDHGINLLAPLKDQDGIIVAHCRAKKAFSASAVKAVSQAFFKHWKNNWQNKNVKRFILMVSCDLQDSAVLSELSLQRVKFSQHKIEYEWWSNSTIVTRLRPHPEIVNRYLPYWLEHICGLHVGQEFSASAGSTVVSAALTAQLEQLMSALAKETGILLDRATQLWKEGKISESENALSSLQQDSSRWSTLQASIRADILTLRGKLALELSDTATAEKFAKEAATLGDFPSVSCLLSLIALVKGDVAQSLSLLNGCTTEAADRIRVSIMIQEGNSADALQLLSKMESTSTQLADTLRLKALALLLQRNVNEALAAIDISLSLQPAWKYSKIVSGMIRFYAALAPIEVPRILPPWPGPIDWSSVAHNDESRQRLQEAASIFDSVRQDAKDKDERESLDGWLIGALANNRSSQKAAEDECRALLEASALHGPAIAWAVARKYHVIGATTRAALISARNSGTLDLNQTLSLVLIYIGEENNRAASEVLDEAEQNFVGANEEKLWQFWRAQLYLTAGDIEKVAGLFGDMSSVPLELLPLVKQKSHLEKLLAERQLDDLHGRMLLDVCISKSKLGDYNYIIANANNLISEVQTEQSIRVISHALIKTDQYEDCVNLLTANVTLFNGQTLPHDLQLVRAQCYQRMGFVNEAVEQAEKAVLLTPNTQTMLAYVTMLLQTGNMPAMIAIVRRLSRQTDLTPVQAIRLAEIIQRDDPLTAKTLWQRSTSGRLKGEYIFRAITLGYQLGMEREPAYINFHRQIQHIAQAGSKQIRAVTLDEAAEEFRKQREANEQRHKTYRNAIVPAHFIYSVPLLYHTSSASLNGATSVLNRYAIFAYHEDRYAASGFPDAKPTWRLNVDISALMIAHEFEFLESVIDANDCIYIPSETIPSILDGRQQLQILPSDRVASINHVLKTVFEKRINLFDDDDIESTPNADLSPAQMAQKRTSDLTEYIKQQGGWFVDFVSPDSPSPEGVQPIHFSQRTDAAAVVLSLQSNSLMPREQSEEALALLPKTNGNLGLLQPPPHSKLYTHATMLETFSHAGVLDQISSNFEVYVSRDEHELLQRTSDDHFAGTENYECLSTLVDRINAYVQQGKIRVLPQLSRQVTPSSEASVEPLYSLLQILPKKHDALWIDDRFANKFIQRDEGVPIVTSWEVLKGLAIGPFGKQRYYETLIKMRKTNIRYIPVEADEIFFHLQQAPIQDDQLIETTELQTLRSYVAACLNQREMVHKHQSNSDPILFFDRIRQGIVGAWDHVWRASASYEHKTLWATWLYEKLFADPRSLSMIATDAVSNRALSSAIGDYLFTALVVFDRGADAADQYLKWLFKSCLKPIFQLNPGLAREVAVVVRQFVTAHLAGDSESTHLPIFQWWYYHMPAIIRIELTDDADSMSMLRLRSVSFGNMFGFTFVWDDLEKAINRALSSGVPQSINTQQVGQVEITAQILADSRVAITLSSSERALSFADDETQYLFNVPHERRLALMRHPQWIDIAPDQFESIVNKLAYTEPASIRIDELQRWQQLNANSYYAILQETLRARRRVHYDRFLPPSIESLLNHYRFRSSNQFSLEETLERVLLEGIESFAELVSGLPCIITAEQLAKIDDCAPNTKRKLVRALLVSRTPLSLIQLSKVLGTESSNRAYSLLRRRIMNRLKAEDTLAEFRAFVHVVRWIGNRFAGIPDARNLSWSTRLALVWLHASKLFGMLRRSGYPVDWLSETFARRQKLTSVAILDSTNPIRDDAATPNLVSAERLLAFGLVYCMSQDELVHDENRLVDLTIVHVDELGTFPKPNLFRSPPQSNVFNSFLGLDVGDLVRPNSALQALSSKSLHVIASEGIQNIRNRNQPYFWWLVLGNVVPRACSSNEFSDAIRSLVAERGLLLLAKEAESAFAPITVVTAHAAASSVFAGTIVEDLKRIAFRAERFIEGLDEQTRTESEFMLYQAFIEAGLALSRKDGDFDPVSFGELMINLSQRCTKFAHGLRNLMDYLWEELPAQESTSLWKLRTYLEAAS